MSDSGTVRYTTPSFTRVCPKLVEDFDCLLSKLQSLATEARPDSKNEAGICTLLSESPSVIYRGYCWSGTSVLSLGSFTHVVVSLYVVPFGRVASSFFIMHAQSSGKYVRILRLPFVIAHLFILLRKWDTPELTSVLGSFSECQTWIGFYRIITGPPVYINNLGKILFPRGNIDRPSCRIISGVVLRV